MTALKPVAMQPSDPFVSLFDSPATGLDGATLRQAIRQALGDIDFPWTFVAGFAIRRIESVPGHAVNMVSIGCSPEESLQDYLGESRRRLMHLALSAICQLLKSYVSSRAYEIMMY